MKVEKTITKTSGRCINVSASTVTSLRINNQIENTVRVYDKGCIGVEGCLGSADFDKMQKTATDKLQQGIAYPETHDEPRTLSVDVSKQIFAEEEFVDKIKHLVARLAKENPEFIFSNKVILDSTEKTYENSDGAHLFYKGNCLSVGLALQKKGSANIMDEFYDCESDSFDEDAICADIHDKCRAFLTQLPQIQEDEVTIIGNIEPLQYAISHFVADLYFNNASIFNGKLGQKLFSEKLNLTINRDPEKQLNLPFFDAEGVVNDGYTKHIVKNGVLTTLLTCKKSAAQYNTENIGAASAQYNGVPTIGIGGFSVQPTAENLQQLVTGKAVYISVTGGGDMTPSGDISIPVMVAYLVENGKLVGKLPEFAVSCNLFDMLGDGFVGACENGFYRFGKRQYFVYKAKLVNKQ